jgi:hypothetical protein
MTGRKAPMTASLIILLALACDNAFEPLLDACRDEMASVRALFVDTPSGERRVTLSDARRAVIWDIAPQPTPGLVPDSVAFIWSSTAPEACTVCYSSDPCWSSLSAVRVADVVLPNKRLKLAARVD